MDTSIVTYKTIRQGCEIMATMAKRKPWALMDETEKFAHIEAKAIVKNINRIVKESKSTLRNQSVKDGGGKNE